MNTATASSDRFDSYTAAEAIREVLRESGEPMQPKDLSAATGKKSGTIKSAVSRMHERGELEKLERGHGLYRLPKDVDTSSKEENVENAASNRLTVGARSDPQATLASLFSQEMTMTVHTDVRVSVEDGGVIYPDDKTHDVTMPRGFLYRILGFHPPATIGVMEVDDDDMEPTVEQGDLVIWEPVDDLHHAGLYVLYVNGGKTVKRVQPLPDSSIRIIPDNQGKRYTESMLVPTESAHTFRLQQTGRTATIFPIGRVLFPDRSTDKIHIEQVGEILRSFVKGEGEDQLASLAS